MSQQAEALRKSQPTGLTTSPDNRLRFGDTVLVRCEGTENKPSLLIAKAARADCFLAAPQLNGPNEVSGVASGLPHPILNDKTALVIQRLFSYSQLCFIEYLVF